MEKATEPTTIPAMTGSEGALIEEELPNAWALTEGASVGVVVMADIKARPKDAERATETNAELLTSWA